MGEGLSPNPAQSHHFTPKDLVTSGESLLQRLDSGIYKQHGVMNPSKMFSCLRKFWIYIVVISLLHLSWSEEVTERCRNKGCQVEVGSQSVLKCFELILGLMNLVGRDRTDGSTRRGLLPPWKRYG